jgi:hypothetical protein
VLSIRRATAPEATHKNLYNLLGIPSERVQKVDRSGWRGEIGACHRETATPRI